MERTEKPWEREGEEREESEIFEEEEEEVSGGLEVRERKRRANGAKIAIGETNGGSFKKEEKVEEQSSVFVESEKVEIVEEESKVEEERNVYFDSEEDSNLHSGTNGTTSAQFLAAPEETPTPKVVMFENGSSSKSKLYSTLPATIEKVSTSNTVVNIKELDLEKVLEEQETHDLYCPNCNSCITRRVILKKRKRIAKNVKSDSRPEKLPNLGQIETTNANLDEREQTSVLFKCLSCFSFFLPTDCGFDIFHLFGGKKDSIQTPSTTQPKDEIQSTTATQTQEGIKKIITAHTKEDIQSIATSETKEKIQITVNKQVSNQISEASNYNWFLGLFQPGGNQIKVTQRDKADNESLIKVVKEGHEENKKSNENQSAIVKNPAISVTVEQKTDIIASSEVSSLSSTTEIIENKEIETSDTKNNTAKVPDLSYIVTKPKDPIEIVSIVNVTAEIPEQITGPVQAPTTVPSETIIDMPKFRPRECGCPGININNWDILKPIVYGGLVEVITSLSIISSAASTGASTLNILLLAAANLIGGLILIIHDLSELKHAQDEADDRNEDELGRYWALLGRKGHFGLHASVAIISYIFFGLLPPLVYAFSFRKMDNSEYKTIAVAASSLVCIAILSLGKAHVRPRRTYFTTMLYYITIGVSASGLSYVAGMLLKQLIESLGLFDEGSSPVPSPPSLISDTYTGVPSWASF
ncbi:Vacuolar iron transporter (VIT) family protein [Rhynchospora pubera]|uniref:Vacuolar iron transporter (VIT) family protein n=1 Tax=Rhynchospora pubera TaxID=906938 RepID=A0AAV8E5S7_9POAL|nr:Vacuolar iron transporter (VIT) family protein [Rhynchospora pubera]